jgi:chemotaxis response regulator CheB
MHRLRVLAAGLPGILYEIVSDVVRSESDIHLEPPIENGASLAEAVERLRPDILILSADQIELDSPVREILERQPAQVLVVTRDGRQASRYRLILDCQVIDDLSPEVLLDVIRSSGLEAGTVH